MRAVCPNRHISLGTGRPQVLRYHFRSKYLRQALEPDPITACHYARGHRGFTVSSARLRHQRSKRPRRAASHENGLIAILNGLARRTITPQAIHSPFSSRPYSLQNQGHFWSLSNVKRKGGKNQRNARLSQKTRERAVDGEALALPGKATNRFTGPAQSHLLTPPAISPSYLFDASDDVQTQSHCNNGTGLVIRVQCGSTTEGVANKGCTFWRPATPAQAQGLEQQLHSLCRNSIKLGISHEHHVRMSATSQDHGRSGPRLPPNLILESFSRKRVLGVPLFLRRWASGRAGQTEPSLGDSPNKDDMPRPGYLLQHSQPDGYRRREELTRPIDIVVNGIDGHVAAIAKVDAGSADSLTSIEATTRSMPRLPQKPIQGAPPTAKRFGGSLSDYEREEISSLLSCLQSIPPRIQRVTSSSSVHKKQVSPSPSSLPLSPFQRLQGEKQLSKAHATAEAKQRLQDNPWAQWLASPVRMCQITGVRLPRALLVGWNYVRNPKDEKIYLMPQELANMAHLQVNGRNRKSRRQESERLLKGVSSTSTDESKSFETPTALAARNEDQQLVHSSGKTPIAHDAGSFQDGVKSGAGFFKDKTPTAPAKIYMRPSSIILEVLSDKLLDKKQRNAMQRLGSSAPSAKTLTEGVNRFIPVRWKEQVRKFEKSTEAGNYRAGYLTKNEMRRVQWPADAHEVMLTLLRRRVIQSMKNVVLTNSRGAAIEKRIIRVPLGEEDRLGKSACTTSASGLEQVVFLWFHVRYPGNSSGSSQSSSIGPRALGGSLLRFEPCQAGTSDVSGQRVQAYVPKWEIYSQEVEVDQSLESVCRQGQVYVPPKIRLRLPQPPACSPDRFGTSSHGENNDPIIRQAPVFDVPTLLGPLDTAAVCDSPEFAQAFGLDPHHPNMSGTPAATGGRLVLIKGGKDTPYFREMVQEMWRLWLYLGGRRIWDGEGGERHDSQGSEGVERASENLQDSGLAGR